MLPIIEKPIRFLDEFDYYDIELAKKVSNIWKKGIDYSHQRKTYTKDDWDKYFPLDRVRHIFRFFFDVSIRLQMYKKDPYRVLVTLTTKRKWMPFKKFKISQKRYLVYLEDLQEFGAIESDFKIKDSEEDMIDKKDSIENE